MICIGQTIVIYHVLSSLSPSAFHDPNSMVEKTSWNHQLVFVLRWSYPLAQQKWFLRVLGSTFRAFDQIKRQPACGSQQHSVPSGAIVETQPALVDSAFDWPCWNGAARCHLAMSYLGRDHFLAGWCWLIYSTSHSPFGKSIFPIRESERSPWVNAGKKNLQSSFSPSKHNEQIVIFGRDSPGSIVIVVSKFQCH
jgi:hypothetical protein